MKINLNYVRIKRQKSETLQKLHADALPMITEGKSIEDEIDDVSEFEMNLQEYIIKVDRLKNCEHGNNDDKTHATITRNFAKLPKFVLKRFNSDPLEWHMFWDTFKSTIDKDESLDNVTKFNHLKGVLRWECCRWRKRVNAHVKQLRKRMYDFNKIDLLIPK